jgi:hypothetical protein
MDGENLTRLYLSTCVNITMYPPVQLLCANKKFFKKVKLTDLFD